MPSRQQFNVNLDPELVRRVKHQAIDDQLSVSEWVGRVLDHDLSMDDPMTQPAPPAGLFLQPMVHVQHMSASVSFYEALGAEVLHRSRDGDFVMLKVGGAQLGLLAHPPNPEQHEGLVELNFETTASLTESGPNYSPGWSAIGSIESAGAPTRLPSPGRLTRAAGFRGDRPTSTAVILDLPTGRADTDEEPQGAR